jgi:response regulator RpfG family c-di-GMP phosphodiesterase
MAESAAGSATSLRSVDRRPGTGRLGNLRVLLVEDADEDAILVQEILNDQSLVLITLDRVSRASEARSCLRARHYDVVLLDLSLPDSQGLEACCGSWRFPGTWPW